MLNKNIQLQLNCFPLNNSQEELNACNNIYNRILRRFNISNMMNNDINRNDTKDGYLFTIRDKLNNRIVSSGQFNVASTTNYLAVEKVIKKITGSLPHWRNNFQENTYSEISALWVEHDYNALGLSDLIVRMCVIAAIKCRIRYLIAFYNKYSKKNALRFGFETRNEIGDNGKVFYPDRRYESTISMLRTTDLRRVHPKEQIIIREMMRKICSNYIVKINNTRIVLHYDLRNLLAGVVAQREQLI